MEPTKDATDSNDTTAQELLSEMTRLRDEAVLGARDLDAMLEATADPMVVYDLQTQIVRCNPAFQALLSTYSDDPTAITLKDRAGGLAMRDMQGDVLPDAQSPQKRMLGGEVITEADPAQIITRGESGREGIFSVTGGPLYHEERISSAVVFFRDITHQHQLEADLRESEQHYRTLFELAPVAVYSCDAEGVIQEYNARAAELWGRAPRCGDRSERYCGSFRMYSPEGRYLPHDQCPMAHVLQGETLVDGRAELLVERPDGQRMTVMAHPQAIRNEHGEIIGAINCFYDITERKLAEEYARASEAQMAVELADMERLQHISSQLIQEGNLDTLYAQILEAAIQLMRADMGSIQMFDPDRNDLRLLAWKGFDPASAAFWETVRVESGSTCGVALNTGERVLAPDVETCDFMAGTEDLDFYRLSGIRAVQSTPLVSREGRLVGMISTHWREPHQPAKRDLRLLDVLARQAADLIERMRTEEMLRRAKEELEARVAERTRDLAVANRSLRRLSQRILEIQESERRLIAQELHDEIGQALTGVKMMLESLEESAQHDSGPAQTARLNTFPDRPTDAPHLGEISAAVAHTLEQVRDLSLNLRPAILDSLGLLPALQWQFERYTNQTGVQVDFSAEGLDRRLPTQLEAGVYRLIQEALTNVARYAGVSAVIVQIYATEETLSLFVVDEGAGFDAEVALDAGVSTGLAGMRERADLLGGTLSIDSIPGEGTTIQADLSISRAIEVDAAKESEAESDQELGREGGWGTERDTARNQARDHLRDLARDSWRDWARDAKRDTTRDSFRDTTRDAIYARERQERQERQEQQEGKE